MIDKFLTKVFGSSNQRYLKTLAPLVQQINDLEPSVKKLSDDEMRARVVALREQVIAEMGDVTAKGEEARKERKRRTQEALDRVLPEVFALTREASVRATGMRHFDVQLIGGIALHQGRIAEMRTGEGKTLVATLPATLNALTGRGVHVVTVNDYLATRDADWMGRIYKHLGLTVGAIVNDLDDWERKDAYGADITYGTNNEFGFDYLRDNMKFDLTTCVQRGHYYGIVDEVDSILIDEARTPLIISGPSDEATDKYYKADAIIPHLKRGTEEMEPGSGKKKLTGDYVVDEKQHSAVLTEEGVDRAEQLLGVGNLYDPSNMEMLHCVEQALKAHTLYKLDHQYIIRDGEVIIVDEFTGRTMPGRRWSDGLHQAVEAKEGVKIARKLQKAGVPHNVLNAKYHDREAEIVAQAGRKGSVTIATNMAGRGTDILLGGNAEFMAREFLKQDEIDPDEATGEQMEEALARAKRIVEAEHLEVVAAGGLHIIGTERHEARRIDNQLRGRAGRQGDPGSSRFFLSLEDDLMR